MKKILLICVLLLALLLCSCDSQILTEENNTSKLSMFIQVENGNGYKIVYHRDTKVMYAISDSSYNIGTFTVMLNADGTPMLWEGTE